MNTIIEKIRAEVERLKKDVDNTPLATEQIAGYLFALVDVQKRLSDLEKEEKPISAYLEKAAEEYASDEMMSGLAERAFIAGAKWQAEQDQETIELAEDHAYLAGAVNEREKMMKEAVEVKVVGFDIENHTIFLSTNPTGLNLKDTVRIIICKKED